MKFTICSDISFSDSCVHVDWCTAVKIRNNHVAQTPLAPPDLQRQPDPAAQGPGLDPGTPAVPGPVSPATDLVLVGGPRPQVYVKYDFFKKNIVRYFLFFWKIQSVRRVHLQVRAGTPRGQEDILIPHVQPGSFFSWETMW